MEHEDILYCFSAKTWNVELLCTLAFATDTSATTDFADREALRDFVVETLAVFDLFMVRVIQSRFSEGFATSTLGASLGSPSSHDSSSSSAGLKRRVERLRDYLSRTMKPGDTQRRSAQLVMPGIFLGGRFPAMQPLLLEYLDIERVLQSYGGRDLARWSGPSASAPPVTAAGTSGDAQLPSLEMEWVPIEWPASAASWHTPGLSADNTARGTLWLSALPISKRPVLKLILPAVDDDSYDLGVHFRDDVFDFLEGNIRLLSTPPTAAVPLSPSVVPSWPWRNSLSSPTTSPSGEASPAWCRRSGSVSGGHESAGHCHCGNTLVHCSAGMHRSAAMVVAFLLHRAALAGNPRDGETNLVRTVDDFCQFVKQRRSVAMPTDAAKGQLEHFRLRLLR